MVSVRKEQPKAVTIEALQRLELGALWRALMAEGAALQCLCAYLFIEYVRPQSIYESLDVLPFALLSILLTTVFWLLDRNKLPTKNAIDKLIIAFTLLVLLSAVFAYSPADAFKNISLPLSWAIVYVLISRVAANETRFFIAFLLFLLFSFKMAQHGFRSWVGRGFSFEKWGVMGAPGWFSNSGEFGIQMTIFLPLSAMFYAAYHKGWGWIKKGIVALMPISASASILASSSRGALLGGIAGLGWLMVTSRQRWKTGAMVVAAGAIGMSLLPGEFAARFETAGADATSLARLERWRHGMETMWQHPLLGVGYDNWLAYYPAHYRLEFPGSLLVHNIFVQAGAELGLTGLLLVIVLFLLCFVNTARIRSAARTLERPDFAALSRGFDAATIGLLASAFFVTVLFYPFLWIQLAFIVAFRAAVERLVREKTGGSGKGPIRGRGRRSR